MIQIVKYKLVNKTCFTKTKINFKKVLLYSDKFIIPGKFYLSLIKDFENVFEKLQLLWRLQ